MGLKFRKSINLGKHFRINIGKNGIGYSYGIKGMRHSVSADGKHRTTYSIPGTGVSYTQNEKNSTSDESVNNTDRATNYQNNKAGYYYMFCMFSLLVAFGCAYGGMTSGVVFFVILAFVLCVLGKKTKWAYEDSIQDAQDNAIANKEDNLISHEVERKIHKEYFYLNKKTKKIHKSSCQYAPSAADKNCIITSEIYKYISQGYSWCEKCH